MSYCLMKEIKTGDKLLKSRAYYPDIISASIELNKAMTRDDIPFCEITDEETRAVLVCVYNKELVYLDKSFVSWPLDGEGERK